MADADRQRLSLVRSGAVEKEFTISTSAGGLGNVLNSHKTPTGFHEVAERFGDGETAGRVFKARKALENVSDEELMKEFSLKMKGHTL